MNIRYLFGVFISLPFLPLMYYQGKRIRKSVPILPEAEGIEGQSQLNTNSKNPLRVLFIGESTIAGVGVKTHSEGFTGTCANQISKLLNRNVKWKVYAHSGYTAKKVDEKIIPKITENKVDLIIIGLGGNDAFTLNRPWKWNAEIRSLLASLKIKFPEAIIVFCNMPTIKEFPAFTPLIKCTIGNLVEILGEQLQRTVNNYEHVFYFGEKITLKGWINKFGLKVNKEDFFSDGVHPSKLTYQTWAIDTANKISNNKNLRNLLK